MKNVFELIKEKGWKITNIDSNIIAQRPKMMPYIPKMKEVLSKILECENISIKAKTNEKMDAVGNELAIEAHAIALLEKI